MVNKKLTITIESNAKVNIDMAGFTGNMCDKERDALLLDLELLGIITNTKTIRHKSEYYKLSTQEKLSSRR